MLVVTGLVQTVRLVGNPMDLFDVDHGRYLAVKIAVLVVMLGSRQHQPPPDRRSGSTTRHDRSPHRDPCVRPILAEFAIGLAIVAITAAMVVSPPLTSLNDRQPAADGPTAEIYYIV